MISGWTPAQFISSRSSRASGSSGQQATDFMDEEDFEVCLYEGFYIELRILIITGNGSWGKGCFGRIRF